MFSNALFHSRMPDSTYGRYSIGTVSSMYQTICFLGGECSARGSAFSSRQRLTILTKFVSESVLPKSFDALRKWPTRSSATRRL
jgi:hypothetical protein